MFWMWFGISLGAALVILVLTVLIRTLAFKPREKSIISAEPVSFDAEKAIRDLAEMIKCKTVSNVDKSLECEEEFAKFKALLPKLFPNIYEKCEFSEVGSRALLYKYSGKSSDAPTVFMSHFDVVSVEESLWSTDPFAGIIKDGCLWGRGSLDTKVTLNSAMQALEAAIEEGFVPENDIYLAFAGDEEISGTGASMIVDLFEKQGITPALVLDEGGAVVEGVFPGVKEPSAMVGIAEKGMLNLEFTYSGNGGHSSAPKPHTPVGILSAACVNVESHPFKFTKCPAAMSMFDTLARRSNFVYRMIFANLWLFRPVLDAICKKSGGEINALLRTTCAFTKMEGSKGYNVIPPSAKMAANLRLIPGETTDSALAYIEKTVNNPEIKITKVAGNDPSVTSVTDCEGWERVERTINETWQNAIVTPYLMVACSDSRHWGRISNKVYRFSTMELSKEERASIHGNDERVPLETIAKSLEFYTRIIGYC